MAFAYVGDISGSVADRFRRVQRAVRERLPDVSSWEGWLPINPRDIQQRDEIYSRSLEELDGKRWGDAPADATGLVERVHRLRTLKLRDLSVEDIATLLGQREGAEWIVPLALDHLEGDPMAGAFFPGQLLSNVLLNGEHWDRFPRDLGRLWSIRQELETRRGGIDKVLADPGWPRDIAQR